MVATVPKDYAEDAARCSFTAARMSHFPGTAQYHVSLPKAPGERTSLGIRRLIDDRTEWQTLRTEGV